MSARVLWDELIGEQSGALKRWLAEARPEDVHLEFKTSKGLDGSGVRQEDKRILAKAMSAFANTDGGVIVLGADAAKRQGGKHDRLAALPGVVDSTLFAERLQAFLRDLTTPAIPGAIARGIEDPQGGPGFVAIHVPLTDAGPFRANGPADVSDRYYIRVASESVPATHQWLAAMFGRRPDPKLRLGFARNDYSIIDVVIQNAGNGSAVLPFVRFTVRRGTGQAIRVEGWSPWRTVPAYTWAGDANDWEAAVMLPHEHRLYAGETRKIGEFKFSGDPTLLARIDCDGAPATLIDWQEVSLVGHEVCWLRSNWEEPSERDVVGDPT
jgi:hypothetical protein